MFGGFLISSLINFLQIQCWDSHPINPRYLIKQFTINITDVNEAPTDLTISNNSIEVSIDENLGAGHEVGVVSAIDPDNELSWEQNITFAIVDQNSTDVPFILVEGSLIETTMDLNYEVKDSYTFNLTATDNGEPQLTTSNLFTLKVRGDCCD